uniref:Spliceosome-associated protein CWC27 homolog (Trinotate prediction) n=1 Tax=Myxobolus squamalis TaxID=59785 RepID=A0A6B2G429_MYXSQ
MFFKHIKFKEMVDKVETAVAAAVIPVLPEPEEDKQEIYRRNLATEQEELKEKLKATKRKVKMLQTESRTKTVKHELIDEKELLVGFGALRKDFTVNESIGEYILSNTKYSKRKKILPILNKSEHRELLTLEMLKSFENDLSQIQQKALIREQQRNEGKEIDLETETGWMNHLLTFDKPSPYISSALDANVEIADRYDITDPRNPINQRKGGLKPKK